MFGNPVATEKHFSLSNETSKLSCLNIQKPSILVLFPDFQRKDKQVPKDQANLRQHVCHYLHLGTGTRELQKK